MILRGRNSDLVESFPLDNFLFKKEREIAGFEPSSWGQFHKPIYALRQALTLCAELLRLKKASQKLGPEQKSLAQSVNGFMKSTP